MSHDAGKEDEIKEIKMKYRGIKEDDLHLRNPSYSCVICSNSNRSCPNYAIGGCCLEHISMEEEEWSQVYDFGDKDSS